jgi:hypothetical protein
MKNMGIIITLLAVTAVVAALLQVQKNDRDQLCEAVNADDQIVMMLVQTVGANHRELRKFSHPGINESVRTNPPVALKQPAKPRAENPEPPRS